MSFAGLIETLENLGQTNLTLTDFPDCLQFDPQTILFNNRRFLRFRILTSNNVSAVNVNAHF